MIPAMNRLIPCALTLLLAACAAQPIDRGLLENARFAITQAERAGGDEYAPLEMRFAREKLAAAEAAIESDESGLAFKRAEESEIEAQLALSRTRAALTRSELEAARAELETLKADLVEAYGEKVLQ